MCSSQIASCFNRRSPSIHCSGTEKLPPPSRYFAANPPPRKTVTRADSSISPRAQASVLLALEDAAVRQVCLALRLMRLVAQSGVRNWLDGAKELRLLPSHQRLLEIVGKRDKLRFMQECAVH